MKNRIVSTILTLVKPAPMDLSSGLRTRGAKPDFLPCSICENFHKVLRFAPPAGYNTGIEALSSPLIEWRDLAKLYGRRRVFSGLSGSLTPGETLVVTGRNGAGKSTFLRVLAGLTRADAGDVLRSIETRIGYAAPGLSLYGELTGYENLAFFRAVSGGNGADPDDLLARVGLEKARGKAVSAYSSGMQQRLKLAFAMLGRPAVLILDEPTLALDQEGVRIVEDLLARQRECGGVIVATNDPEEARRWSASGRSLALGA